MADLGYLMGQAGILLSCGLAWTLAQGVKSLLFALKHHQFDWRAALVGTGGMPSSHSALVAALAASIFANEGISTAFVVALAYGLVILRDAAGVRLAAGNQAIVLNELIIQQRLAYAPLPVSLGHKPQEVVAGVITGVVTALVIFWWI